jgi:catechol 2,3-dioxygenase-like lactoylglutathione lyase family enzyme
MTSEERADLGWTHVALPARDLDASIAFYAAFADLAVVHERISTTRVVWLGDGLRPFVLVLVQATATVEHPLGPFAHLGIAVESRARVDAIAAGARAEGRLRSGPHDDGPPVGYWCFVADPDGHTIEFAFGQHVGATVARAPAAHARDATGRAW